jgi:hypothetical protein
MWGGQKYDHQTSTSVMAHLCSGELRCSNNANSRAFKSHGHGNTDLNAYQ